MFCLCHETVNRLKTDKAKGGLHVLPNILFRSYNTCYMQKKKKKKCVTKIKVFAVRVVDYFYKSTSKNEYKKKKKK